jgi:ankyrin repeat protein
MVDFLLERYTTRYPGSRPYKIAETLEYAIRGENMAVIRHLIARGANVKPEQWPYDSCNWIYNPEIIEILLSHGARPALVSSIFTSILKSDKTEDEVFEVLHRMHKYVVGKGAFSNGCRYASKRGSIPLVKYFLDNGADINYRTGEGPLLYEVVRGYTRRNAEVIRFLLQQGADPNVSNSKGQSIKSLVGMRKVEKYFNKSWDDLVREAQAERAGTTDEG